MLWFSIHIYRLKVGFQLNWGTTWMGQHKLRKYQVSHESQSLLKRKIKQSSSQWLYTLSERFIIIIIYSPKCIQPTNNLIEFLFPAKRSWLNNCTWTLRQIHIFSPPTPEEPEVLIKSIMVKWVILYKTSSIISLKTVTK